MAARVLRVVSVATEDSSGGDGRILEHLRCASNADVGKASKCRKVSSHVSSLQSPAHLSVLLEVEGDVLPDSVLLSIEDGSLVVMDAEASDVSGETPVLHALDLGLEEVVVVGDFEEVVDPHGETRRG